MIECPPDDANPLRNYYFAAITETKEGITTVYIRPPIVMYNYLPCPLYMVSQTAANSREDALGALLTIESGKEIVLTDRREEDFNVLKLKLKGFEWSRPANVRGGEEGEGKSKEVKFRFVSDREELVYVTLELQKVSKKRLELVAFSRYWVFDRTGLYLGFCEDPKARKRRVESKSTVVYKKRLSNAEEMVDATQELKLIDFKVSN